MLDIDFPGTGTIIYMSKLPKNSGSIHFSMYRAERVDVIQKFHLSGFQIYLYVLSRLGGIG